MHSPNCNCYACTSGGDPYITHVRNQFGKNANFDNTRNGGVVTNFNAYERDDADVAVKTIDLVKPNATVAPTQANMKQIFGDALGNALGNIIQAKKDGQTLPKGFDIVAQLGIKTEQAAVNAAQGKAATSIGTNVIKFSPYIIGGLVAFVLLFFFVLGKKR